MISPEEARNALPPDYKITDSELASVIADAYLIANLAVNDYLRGKQSKEKKP